jgi:DNA-binding CsgD family transcriptional regulator
MYSRVIEGLLVLFEDYLINNYIRLIIVMIIILSLLIFLYYLLYINRKEIKETDLVKKTAIKYGLSNQETKVLDLLVKGKSNQEMADELFISIYTVKRHVSNIYQKTNMNKKELIKKCY